MHDSSADNRGSLWRKWDFQVHTPASHLNNQFGHDWDLYVQGLFRTAIAKDLAAIALTDYFTIDGYKRVRQDYLDRPEKLAELFTPDEVASIQKIRVFPNVEFRLNKIIDNSSRVNAHVLLSDALSIRDIEENFLHDLEFTEEAQPQSTAQKRKLKVENLRELGARLQTEHAKFQDAGDALFVGMMNAVVDDDSILKGLGDSRFKDKFLFCVVADEDLPKLKWDSQAHHSRKVLIQRSDALFSGNPSTRSWALAQPPYTDGEAHFMKEFISLKACLHGSDAHGLQEIGHPCTKRGDKNHSCDPASPEVCELRYCWIKGDATFEGLRQILHEPADRAFIGPSTPDFHDKARTLSSVTLSDGQGWFADAEIPLNPSMVSIIGQKGSGKSALADLIAYAAGSWIADDEGCFLHRADPHLDGLTVTLHWADGTSTSETVGGSLSDARLVRYLSQNYVERICARDGMTRELVREIEQVIFSYLDPVDTLNASDFAELRAMKTASVTAESGRLKTEISTVIRDEFVIRDLQAKLPEKRTRLATLTTEREGLAKQLPAPASEAEAKVLAELQAKREALARVQQLAASGKHVSQRLTDLGSRMEAFSLQIDRFYEEIKPALAEAGIPETAWPAFKPTFSLDYRKPIQDRAAELAQKQAELEGGDPPAAGTIRKITAEIAELSKQELTDKARQERTRQIQVRIATINLELGRLETEIETTAADAKRLEGIQTRRFDAYQNYFANLAKEQAVLQSLYDPIRDQLNAQALLKGKDLEFAIRWNANIDSWLSRGEALFDQRRTIPHVTYDQLGKAARKGLLPAWTSGDAVRARDAIDAFLQPFRDAGAPQTYLRANVTAKDLLTWIFEVDHITLDYGLKFNNSDLESLSPGTKGIVLLMLYLGMDVNDTRPLIVDQPDENLDNESIYALLTPYFRTAKIRRQIIVITHNPNLVVNSDTEQVVIATGEKQESGFPVIHYSSGALENPETRQQVCNILEGGNEAFLKRDRRYAIPRR